MQILMIVMSLFSFLTVANVTEESCIDALTSSDIRQAMKLNFDVRKEVKKAPKSQMYLAGYVAGEVAFATFALTGLELNEEKRDMIISDICIKVSARIQLLKK